MARQQVNFEWHVGEAWETSVMDRASNAWRTWPVQLSTVVAARIVAPQNVSRGNGAALAVRGQTLARHPGAHHHWLGMKSPVTTMPAGRINEHWLIGRIALALVIGFCGLLLAGGMDESPTVRDYQAARSGVFGALAMEAEAWQTDDVERFATLVANRVGSRWMRIWLGQWNTLVEERQDFATTLVTVELLPDYSATTLSVTNRNPIAMATVRVNRPPVEWWQSSPYLETRFYQQTNKGWLRTLPPTDFWGPRHTMETTHLRFEYHQRDAYSVEPMIDSIESIYVALHELLGIPTAGDLNGNNAKPILAIKPDRVRIWASFGDQVEITSPVLAQIPEGLSRQDYVALQFINELTYPIIAKSRRQYNELHRDAGNRSNLRRWEFVIWGLRGWLSTQLLGYRTPWQHEAEQRFRQQIPERLPLDLTDIAYWRYSRAHFMWQSVAVESLISYVVDEHGLETLPELVRGFNQFRHWEELVADIYGTSVEEFVNDWNRYIQEKYGI